MTYLITLLISLLGYGQPEDFSHMTEAELEHEIEVLQAEEDATDGGVNNPWEFPDVDGGSNGGE